MRSVVGVQRLYECSQVRYGMLRLFTAGNVQFCNYLSSVQMRSGVGIQRPEECSRVRDGILRLYRWKCSVL